MVSPRRRPARRRRPSAPPAETITGAVLALADVDRLGLVANDLRLSHAEVVARAAARAAWLQATRHDGPFHVALMLDNVPEFIFWLEAAALAGAVVVGANPTHRGDELVRDLAHTECQYLITDSTYLPLVDGARIGDALGEVGPENDRVLVLDTAPAQNTSTPTRPPIRRRWPSRRSRLTPSGTSSSRRGPPARPRPACAARVAWPASGRSWRRCTRSSRQTSATSPCRSSTPTR